MEETEEEVEAQGGKKKYRKFNDDIKRMRERALNSIAREVIEHQNGREGRCCAQGFVAGILSDYTKLSPMLEITRDCIKNAVKRFRARDVTPTHAVQGATPPESESSINPTISSELALLDQHPSSGDSLNASNDEGTLTSSMTSSGDSSNSGEREDEMHNVPSSAYSVVDLESIANDISIHVPDMQEVYGWRVPEDEMFDDNDDAQSTNGDGDHDKRASFEDELPDDDMTDDDDDSPPNTEGSATAAGVALSDSADTSPYTEESTATVVALPNSTTSIDDSTSSTTSNDPPLRARKKAGRPKGTTNAAKEKEKMQRKKAINSVVVKYAALKEEAVRANEESTKRTRVSDAKRKELVAEAIKEFGLKGAFDVPSSTIHDRIKSGNLVVFHRGPTSLTLAFDLIVKGLLLQGCAIRIPLNKKDTLNLANTLIMGSELERKFIQMKTSIGLDCSPDAATLGEGWYRGFKKRNPDIVAKAGRKFENHRDSHCNYSNFLQMYTNSGHHLIRSGNAVKFEPPVHMDVDGNVVEDESLAFGCPVSINIIHPNNVFCMDETGDNTHGKSDGKKGGEKFLCGKNQTPKLMTGSRDSHFTSVPFTNFCGDMVFLVVIFASKKMPRHWCAGDDPFAPYDKNVYSNNFGPGKRYPGLTLTREDGKEVPVFFAHSENGSMTGAILTQVFQRMDKEGIATRTFDENGNPTQYPIVILDGHSSRTDGGFLRYINQRDTKWLPVLGVPYGTSIWQVHDDKRQNGAFKGALVDAKNKYIRKKMKHNLKPEIVPTDIVIILKDAVNNSFLRRDYTKKALSHRGWYPFNMSTLMDRDILPSAPDDVRQAMIAVMRSRGIDDAEIQVLPATDANLLNIVSGHLSGREVAAEQIAETMLDLNANCATAVDIVTALGKSQRLQEGRINHMQQSIPTSEELTETYHKAPKLTPGTFFGQGDGALGPEVLEAFMRNQAEIDTKAAAKAREEKRKRHKILCEYQKIKPEMMSTDMSKWSKPNLLTAIRCKKKAKEPFASGKPLLTAQWISMRGRTTPNCSPVQSNDEDDQSDQADEEEIEMHPI